MSKGIMNRRDKMIWDNSALPTIDDVTGQISDLAESVAGDLEDAYEELDDKIDQAITDCTYTAGTNIEIDEDNVINCTLEAGNGIEISSGSIALTEDNIIAIKGNNYSTTPFKTGSVWIDNNDIFKLTINIGTLPNASTATVAHSISGIDKVIKWEAIAMGSTLYADFVDMVTVDATNVNIDTGSVDMSGYTGYVTVYYTLKKQFAKLTSEASAFYAVNSYTTYLTDANNTNDIYVGLYSRFGDTRYCIAVMSKSDTARTFHQQNYRGASLLYDNDVTLTQAGGHYYATIIEPGTSIPYQSNGVGIQVIFNSLSDCLNAFYN